MRSFSRFLPLPPSILVLRYCPFCIYCSVGMGTSLIQRRTEYEKSNLKGKGQRLGGQLTRRDYVTAAGKAPKRKIGMAGCEKTG